MTDTPQPWCPLCRPEADQILELLETVWCGRHAPGREGLDDAGFRADAEALVTNNAWCALIHGRED